MQANFKNWSLLLLAITALVCSRTMFVFFDDPEGPNLLVVTGMAAAIYLPSLTVYLSRFFPSLAGIKRVLAAILVQTVVTAGFYLGLR